ASKARLWSTGNRSFLAQAVAIISDHIATIEQNDASPTVILGCAGMTSIHGQLQARHMAVLVDPIMAAARLMPALF
ncbi:MAG: hypothetical protein VW989_00765, partial [Rhodobiaceae bacterium]